MSDPFKLKDVPIEELQAAARQLVGIGNGRSIERGLWASGKISEESRQSRQHLRRLLHTLARDNDEAKEGLERLGLMPKDPKRAAKKTLNVHEIQQPRAYKRKPDEKNEQDKAEAKKPKINSELAPVKSTETETKKQGRIDERLRGDIGQHSTPNNRGPQEASSLEQRQQQRQQSAPTSPGNFTRGGGLVAVFCNICYESFHQSDLYTIEDHENEKTRSVCPPCWETPRHCKKCNQKIEISWPGKWMGVRDRCKRHQELVCEVCRRSFNPPVPEGKSYVDWEHDSEAWLVCETCQKGETEHLCDYEEEGEHYFKSSVSWGSAEGWGTRRCDDHQDLGE